MILKPDVTFSEIDDPPNRWCDAGHVAPTVFSRTGPDGILEKTKFFNVYGNAGGQQINKNLCEPCCIIINFLADKKRKSKNQ